MDTGMFEAVKVLGLVGASVAFIASISWYLLKKSFDSHEKERNVWLLVAETHFRNQEKAHEYQRTEHDRIVQSLNESVAILKSINGK